MDRGAAATAREEGNDTTSLKLERGATIVRKEKVTINFMRTRRRVQWEIENDWDEEDIDRKIDSTESLKEDFQDFSKPMVIVGSDVISLYPNLDTDKIAENMGEIKWSNIDLMEGARYLALNWSEEQVRSSSLRRVIPRRRKNKGTGPGMRGEGPRGRRLVIRRSGFLVMLYSQKKRKSS